MLTRTPARSPRLCVLAVSLVLAACTPSEPAVSAPPGPSTERAPEAGMAPGNAASPGNGAAANAATPGEAPGKMAAAPAGQTAGASTSLPAPADSSSAIAINQAQVLRKQGNPAGAAELLQKELATHADDVALNREFQDAMREAGKVTEARDIYAQRLKATPSSAVAQYLYGRSVIRESPREAEAAFRKAIQLDPHLLWPYLGLGTIHGGARDFFAAIQTYEDALKQFPTSAELYYNLANSYHDIGALPKSVDAAARAIKLRPDFAAAYTISARSSFDQQDFESARAALEKGLSLDPQMPDANLLMAQLYAKKGDVEKAREYAVKAAKLGQSIPDDLKAQLKHP